MRCKYIIYHNPEIGKDYAVLFPNAVYHDAMDTGVGYAQHSQRVNRHSNDVELGEAVAAGFVEINYKNGELDISCGGNSETMGLSSRPRDKMAVYELLC